MNSILKQSLRILAGRGVVSVFSLAITIYFAYELPKALFALTVLYGTLGGLLLVVTDLGLHVMVIKEAAQPFRDGASRRAAIQKIIGPCTVLRALASIVTCVVVASLLLGFRGALERQFPGVSLTYVLVMASLGLLAQCLSNVTVAIFSIADRFGRDSFLFSFAVLLEGIFGMAGYVAGGLNQYFLGVALAQMVTLAIRCVLVADILREVRLAALSWRGALEMLRSYFPVYLRTFVRFGVVQGEQVVVAVLLPLAQLANFYVARRVALHLKTYVEAFGNPLMVHLAAARDLSRRRQYQRSFLAFTLPVCAGSLLLSPWLTAPIGGEKYAACWPIAAVLCVSWGAYAIATLQMCIVTIFGDNKDILYVDVVGGLVGIVATWLLIAAFAERGLAWGQVVSYVTLAAIGHRFTRQYERAPAPSIAVVAGVTVGEECSL